MTDNEIYDFGIIADKFLQSDLWIKKLEPFFEKNKNALAHQHINPHTKEEEKEKIQARYIACDIVKQLLKEAVTDGKYAKERLDEKAAERQEKLRRKR